MEASGEVNMGGQSAMISRHYAAGRLGGFSRWIIDCISKICQWSALAVAEAFARLQRAKADFFNP